MIDTFVKMMVKFRVHMMDAKRFIGLLEDYLGSEAFIRSLKEFISVNYPEYELSWDSEDWSVKEERPS